MTGRLWPDARVRHDVQKATFGKAATEPMTAMKHTYQTGAPGQEQPVITRIEWSFDGIYY